MQDMNDIAREKMRRIDAVKMWCYKRMEKISWTNREDLEWISKGKSILEEYVQKRKD